MLLDHLNIYLVWDGTPRLALPIAAIDEERALKAYEMIVQEVPVGSSVLTGSITGDELDGMIWDIFDAWHAFVDRAATSNNADVVGCRIHLTYTVQKLCAHFSNQKG